MNPDSSPQVTQHDERLITGTVSDPSLTILPKTSIGPPKPRETRVTFITKLYHQLPGGDATGPQTPAYMELMENDEQPYQRHLKVKEEWVPIDFGWTGEIGCSFLHIVNEYKVRRRMTPTPEERQEELMHVLEIGKVISIVGLVDRKEYVEPLFVLYVGQPITLSPLGQLRYRIRCRQGEGHYSVFCIPSDPITE